MEQGELVDLLKRILSPDPKIKQAAEKQLKTFQIEKTDAFCISLVRYVVYSSNEVDSDSDSGDNMAVGELAATILKQHIETHWSSESKKYQPPEIKLDSKIEIKKLLPSGLQCSNETIVNAVINSIGKIAYYDWPENWPTLRDDLIRIFDETDAYYNVMVMLTRLTRRLTESKLPQACPIILREIYRIFEDKNKYLPRARGMAVGVFTQMVTTVAMFHQPDLVQEYLEPFILKFCAQFVQNDLKSCPELGCEILKAIQKLTETLPKCIATFLPKILPLIWETLTHSAQNLNENESANLDNLILAIFEFISTLMSGSNGSTLDLPEYQLLDYHWFYLQDSLPPDVLRQLIVFIEIPDQQIKRWIHDPNQFILEEKLTEKSSHPRSTIRSKAQELLMKIIRRPERAATNALCDMIMKHVEAGDAMRANGDAEVNQNWWKLHEASIQVFGLLKEIVVKKQQEGTLNFDVTTFLQHIILANLNDLESHPLLIGRCLYIGGLYAEHMPLEMKSDFLAAMINGLKNHPACTRICAATAAGRWFRAVAMNENAHDKENILRSYLPTLCQELFHLGNQFMSVEVLTIVLQNFATLASIDKSFTASIGREISALAIAGFVHFHSDCSILGICQKIFTELTLNPVRVELLQIYLIPILVGKLNAKDSTKLSNEEAQVDALEILMLLVQHSPQPLSNFLIGTAFPAICRFILNSDKYLTLLKGGKAICLNLSVATEQVIGYKNTDGKTGPQYILQVASHLLRSEHGNRLVEDACELVILLIRKTSGTLGENVDKLFQAVFKRMEFVQTRDSTRKLLMVWAHFINTDFEAVFKFLNTVEASDGKCALTIVISDGFCKEHNSFDSDDRKIVTLALSKILKHSVTHQDSKLHKINYNGNYSYTEKIWGNTKGGENHEGNVCVGRSCINSMIYAALSIATEGDQESVIPLLVELSKLISNELSADTRGLLIAGNLHTDILSAEASSYLINYSSAPSPSLDINSANLTPKISLS